ncbi:hypothetical protein F9B13_01870 [Bacillus subtilis]|uniref:Uncharacterized protein n=1 Tax=Bacillus subtilis TaxID=1423 RepID=A0AAP1DZX4_BACIU|nr:hypothetical protein BAX60_03695 [Bacillus subtilis]ASB95305.1 hypothetical protein S101392_03861 [Bacillus subtilis subsp. subtilis]CJS90374.1 Uncharacterised protein [Streptococcus pneumoniae]KIN54805.1 hypothetical protein B4146_4125 [Bacillus subtilis]KZD86611.1 hypothetical protein B4122_4853 [Bacillus subtilis]
MFYYNLLKQKFISKYFGFSILFSINAIIIFIFFKRSIQTQNDHIIDQIFTYQHLVLLIAPLIVVFTLLVSSDYFMDHAVIRLNSSFKIVGYYFLKSISFSAILGIIVMGEIYILCFTYNIDNNLLTVSNFLTHVFAYIFIAYLTSFLILLTNQILVVIIEIILFLFDYLECNGILFLNGFLLNFDVLKDLLVFRVGLMFILFGVCIQIVKKQDYLRPNDQKGTY